MTKITRKSFLKAVKGTGGIQLAIAEKLNCERTALWKFLNKHPELRERLDQERESIVDMAEGALFSHVKNKERWATKYVLSTLGRQRGYVKKQEIEHTGDNPVKLIITDEDNKYPKVEE